MKKLLQELANQNQTCLINSMDEMEWGFSERYQKRPPESNQTSPSVWELARHLSNWIIVLIPPMRKLELRGDIALVSCLESTDRYISTLATIMLGNEEFNHVGSIEKSNKVTEPQASNRPSTRNGSSSLYPLLLTTSFEKRNCAKSYCK